MKKQVSYCCSDCGNTITKYIVDADPLFYKDTQIQQLTVKKLHELDCSKAKALGFVNVKMTYHEYHQLKWYLGRYDYDGIGDDIVNILEKVMRNNTV